MNTYIQATSATKRGKKYIYPGSKSRPEQFKNTEIEKTLKLIENAP